MKNEFAKLMKEICAYYKSRGFSSMERLAEGIGVSDRRTVQYWVSGERTPYQDSLRRLSAFLESHNGGQFIVGLRNIFGTYYFEESELKRGEFPKELDEKDVDAIRDGFPGPDEFSFLCSMIINENKSVAAADTLPNGTIVQKAALISSYEVHMERAKEVFGIDGVYDWQNKVIRYIGTGQIPQKPGDVEALGQMALDNIIYCYLSRKERRN